MLNRLSLDIYDAPDGELLDNWSTDAQNVIAKQDEFGYFTLEGFTPMHLDEGMWWFSSGLLSHFVISDGLYIYWEGRLEDIKMVTGGIEWVAYGYWNEFTDRLYTALWSDTSSADWRLLDDNDSASISGDRWEGDNNNRLRLAPRKGEKYENSDTVGSWGYEILHGSDRLIQEITFNYAIIGASGLWQAQVKTANSDWSTNIDNAWTLVTDGTLQTGTITKTFSTPKERVVFQAYYDSATATEYTGETGDVYFKISGIRVKTYSGTSLCSCEIAKALVDYACETSNVLAPDYALIQQPGIDIDKVEYEDKRPSEILAGLVTLGQATGENAWETGVFTDRRLHFRPRHMFGEDDGYHEHWRGSVAEVNFERSISELYNATYATYKNTNMAKRTALQKSDDSIAVYGIQREATIDTPTTSQSGAEGFAQVANAQTAFFAPRGQIILDDLTHEGADACWCEIRTGDTMSFDNLPYALAEEIGLVDFRIKTTEYNLTTGLFSLTPVELPAIDVVVGQI